jgi:hypothetical protein
MRPDDNGVHGHGAGLVLAPLPLAGEVGAQRRVRVLSIQGLSRCWDALSPALPRMRGRERAVIGT